MAGFLEPVSIVIVTYNRLETLQPTLMALLQNTDYPRDKLEVIVTDDGSDQDVLRRIRSLPIDRLITTSARSGLSANVNRGLAAATHDLVLQLQDDWVCDGPDDYLRRAVAAVMARPDVGLLLLNTHPNTSLPRRETVVHRDDELVIFDNDPRRTIRRVGQHAYSDWPHVKTRRFIDHVGAYNEALQMWDAELDYSRRVNAQTTRYVAQLSEMTAFSHIGAELSYNTGSLRARFSRRVRKIPVVGPVAGRLKQGLKAFGM